MIVYFRLLIKHGFVNIQNKVKGIAKNLVKAVVLIVYFPYFLVYFMLITTFRGCDKGRGEYTGEISETIDVLGFSFDKSSKNLKEAIENSTYFVGFSKVFQYENATTYIKIGWDIPIFKILTSD